MARLIRRLILLAIALPLLAVLAYRLVDPPGTLLMVVRDAPADYRWVPLSEISPHVGQAAIVSEDQTFCQHFGIDWRQMEIVLAEFVEEGRPSRGASTITMQAARNLYLWPARSALRKLAEIPLALTMELAMPKRRILELYLNVIEWGDGIYGIEAAAQRHFNKPASALTRAEAARLVAVLPNPLDRDPARPSSGVRSRAAQIARDAGRLGYLTECAG